MKITYICPACIKVVHDEKGKELKCEFCRNTMCATEFKSGTPPYLVEEYWEQLKKKPEFNENLYRGRLAFEDTPEEQAKWQEEKNKVIEENLAAQREANTVRCPICRSTNISTGARGWKWTTGFIGSGKTVNRCANCGHTWTPKRW